MNVVSFPRKREPSVFRARSLDPRLRGDDTADVAATRMSCRLTNT